MAKASVLIKCQECGNTFTWSKKDCKNRDEANRAEEWARTGGVIYCPDCMRKFKAKQYKKKNEGKKAQIMERISGYTLIQLEGSEKQISWAENIRITALSLILAKIDEWATDTKIDSSCEEYVDTMNSAIDFINSTSLAKEWIDKKDKYESSSTIMELFKEYVDRAV